MADNSFEIMFEKLCLAMKDQGNVEETSSNFRKLKSDFDRVEFLLQLDLVSDIIQLPLKPDADGIKSLTRSQQLRNEGNKCFQKKNYVTALQKYTECLASSPWPSQDMGDAGSADNCLSLGYANRSAVLLHLDEHQLALQDVDNAFKHGYPKELAYKLHQRKARCLIALGRQAEAVPSLVAGVTALKDAQLDAKKLVQWKTDLQKEIDECGNESVDAGKRISVFDSTSCDKNLPGVVDGKNATFSSLSSACNVRYEPDRGRFIVATRDILPGEVLLIEKPYASILLADHYGDHCYHCFKHTLAPYPCSGCCYAMYCSNQCRNISQETYHRFECSNMDFLRAAGVDKFAYLSLRTLAATPLPDLLRYRKATGQYQAGDSLLVGCNRLGQYTSDEYHAICNLVTHADDRNAHDLFRRAIIAIALLRCLQQSGYFASLDPEERTSDVLTYVGGLLLSHLQSFPCNAHEISEFGLDPGAVVESVPHELGAGIYATLSLFNHSCDPGASRNFYADVCVVRAIKSIRSGCEVSDNYGAVYAVQSREERQKKLRPQYFFDCRCEACTGDWPTFAEIKPDPPNWHCSRCYSPLRTSGESVVRCVKCRAEQNLILKLNELAESDKAYRVAFDRLLKCEVAEALPNLLNHLATMDRLLCLPCMDYSCCQEAVKQCFSIMANCVLKKQTVQ